MRIPRLCLTEAIDKRQQVAACRIGSRLGMFPFRMIRDTRIELFAAVARVHKVLELPVVRWATCPASIVPHSQGLGRSPWRRRICGL